MHSHFYSQINSSIGFPILLSYSRRFSVLLVISVLIIGCQKQESYDTIVYGHLYDKNSTDPIANTWVYLSADNPDWNYHFDLVDSSLTDENGAFSLSYIDKPFRSTFRLVAESEEHLHPPKTSGASWGNSFPAGFQGQRNLYLWPKAWLRIHAVKASNASYLLLGPTGENSRSLSIYSSDTTVIRSIEGNDTIGLPCFQFYEDSYVPLPQMVFAQGHDTTDFYLEW